ncbi:MAG: FtsK/SpoIIIE domain-containing protein, partial [Verrucomicrobiota bacterium]
QLDIPLSLTYPEHGSLLFETHESAGPEVINTFGNIILRLLSTTPPGKLAFTIIDPVGLGKNFAGLMHLADYEESLINRRIWTQRDHIEARLNELAEQIEKIIQMYLRNEYLSITEYNEKAGSVAEKYLFLVIADFPANFSESAAKRLQSIALSGPRCGIFTLIHWDQRHPLPDGFTPHELRNASLCLHRENGVFSLTQGQPAIGSLLSLDPQPHPDLAVALTHLIGKASIDSNRVEVPFSQITPPPESYWTNDTAQELKIPIGRTGATKLQYLAIGKGTRQHALFAGKTGSGKSTLFHVIITNLALACSPDQVEFYLIDFKKGVEFKCYAEKRLPHARVVAIESDREFALSVLQRVDDELKRRGDLFRKFGVQDLAGYRRAGGPEPLPRSLLLIDEFQEFFVDDDSIAQTASLLFDRIVRQGRAFGIHVILGSQTLGGAYSLARATLGQMVIRVALQCNEADAYLIMDDSNSAPRLLSRPGEGIYNDAAGAVEGNSPFQVVWLPDDERDRWLDQVQKLASLHPSPYPSPVVFEGNAPAEIRENDLLRAVLTTPPTTPSLAPRAWLGAPNSIKGPTEIIFHRQAGNHLLIVGQRDESALAILGLSLLALTAQFPKATAQFFVIHSLNPQSAEEAFLEKIIASTPQKITVITPNDLPQQINELASELKARSLGQRPPDAPPLFLFIHGLHKIKKLRHEDDFSFSSSDSAPTPSAQFAELLTEGSSHGIHLLVSVDTFNNLNRSLSRKALSEFAHRVIFQMSANDSASLVDSPKASNLGLHRALLFNDQAGSLETFRPYAIPDHDWFSTLPLIP